MCVPRGAEEREDGEMGTILLIVLLIHCSVAGAVMAIIDMELGGVLALVFIIIVVPWLLGGLQGLNFNRP